MSIGRLQTEADLSRWVENLFGERFGLVPMHRISGTLNSSQIGGGEPSDGDVPAADSSAEGRGVKWTAPADTDFATDADLAAHEADTTAVHGIDDTSQIAFKNEANTFMEAQTIDDPFGLSLQDGGPVVELTPNSAGHIRIGASRIWLDAVGDVVLDAADDIILDAADVIDAFSNRITNLADAAAATDAVNRQFGDGRWETKDALLTAIAALSMIDNRIIVGTGADTVELWTVTDFIKTLFDDGSAGAARTTLGAQAQDALLDELAAAADDAAVRAVLGVPADINLSGTHAARPAAGTAGRFYFETDTGVLYRDTGAAWLAQAPGTIRKTANQTLNQSSTTLQDVTGLALPVEAGENWFVELFLLLSQSGGVADWKFGFTGPVGAVMFWGVFGNSAVTPGNWNAVDTATAPGAARSISQTVAIGSVGGTHLAHVAGLVRNPTNAGSIQFQAAQNTADASNNIIAADSWMRVTRLV